MGVVDATLAQLAAARDRCGDRVLVSFSGGKDSAVVLDLAKRSFTHVEAFFMHHAPGIACVEEPVIEQAARYGVKLHMIPHWQFLRQLKHGHYCFDPSSRAQWPDVSIRDVYHHVQHLTGIKAILVGAKRADGRWRRQHLALTAHWDDIMYPILEWDHVNVLGYLDQRKIKAQSISARLNGAGIDLTDTFVCWLHDTHYDDYLRMQKLFPFIGALVARRDIYGVKAKYDPQKRARPKH